MMQWERNRVLVAEWVRQGVESDFPGWMAIVSDPVDLLCKEALLTARGIDPSWAPDRIRGYGLGVMHGRGCYYCSRDKRFASYEEEGRAFGPHGKGLVLANISQIMMMKYQRIARKLGGESRAREKGTNLHCSGNRIGSSLDSGHMPELAL